MEDRIARGMVVNCVAYAHGHRIKDIPIEEISDVLTQDGTFVWVGLLEPSEPLLKHIQGQFRLHDLAIEDAHCAHQRPKLESYDDSVFVVLHTAQLWDDAIHFGETHIFLGERYLVSVRHGASVTYAQVRARVEHNPPLLGKGPSYALYALIDFVVENYLPIVKAFQSRLHQLETGIFTGAFNHQTIERLYALTRELVSLRFAVAPLQDICSQLAHFHGELIPPDMRPYFRDIYDHTVRINEATDTMRELVTAAIQVHLASINVGQNEVVKRLAGWAAILAIPTMVASFYGMNFEYMPELKWHYGYPALVMVTAVACVFLHQRLKRKGWV